MQTPSEFTGKRFAVKTIRPELLWHGGEERFKREVLLWTSLLPHPNVVKAMFMERRGNHDHLWLEFVDGGSLRNTLRGKPLPPEEVISVALQFCAGMEFLWESAAIIHRDIKPENILLTRSATVKISDFGLAKALAETSTSQTEARPARDKGEGHSGLATQRGALLGTLAYMSPEQFRSADSVNVSSDVYSFGVVLYEMLTGSLPFHARTVSEWLQKHEQEPVPPFRIAGDRYCGLEDVVLKCLQKNPECRFTGFTELRSTLEEICVAGRTPELIPAKVSLADLEAIMDANKWSFRGVTLAQLGDYAKSYECYRRAADLDPELPFIHANLGTALRRLGRGVESMAEYEREVQLHPDFPQGHGALADEYATEGKIVEALASATRVVELDPGGIAGWRRYARYARLAGLNDECRRGIEEVKRLLCTPAHSNPRSAVNEAIQMAQQLDNPADPKIAMEFHFLSVQKYPRFAPGWYNAGVTIHRRAIALAAIDDPKVMPFRTEALSGAVTFYGNALQLDPSHIQARLCRGLASALLGNGPDAIADWRAATLADPQHISVQLTALLLIVGAPYANERNPEFVNHLIDTAQRTCPAGAADLVRGNLFGPAIVRYQL